jgi:hypothetical protein
LTERLSFAAWDSDSERKIDLFVASCGYEPRSIHATERLIETIARLEVLDYESGHVHSYAENRAYFERVGTLSPLAPDSRQQREHYLEIFRSSVPELEDGGDRIHVGVDVSSCDRQRLADLVLAVLDFSRERALDVTFVYSLGDFDTTAMADDVPVMVNNAIRGFEGWSSDPALPVTCVVGLGYEHRMALAAVETLEPSRTAAFIAANSDPRFEGLVEDINSEILGSGVTPVLHYDLTSPLSTLALLDSYVGSALASSRVVLVPLGPKLFALVAVLVALLEGPEVAVWRVSADASAEQQARRAAGPVVGLTVRFND